MGYTMIEVTSSKLWLINFYREQLSKFLKLGMGKRTEHNVLITEKLIQLTEKRLNDLSIVYEAGVSDQAMYQRRQLIKRKEQSGQSPSVNGATITSGEQSNGSTRSRSIRRAFVRPKEKR